MFDGRYEVLSEKDGEKLYDWANTGDIPAPTKETVKYATATEATSEDELKDVKKEIIQMCTALGGTKNETLMAELKKVVPSGNPNAIKDIESAKTLLATLKTLQ